MHWVSVSHALTATVRVYDHLFNVPDPEQTANGKDWLANLNPDSLTTLADCQLEPSLRDAKPGSRFQFERLGYFCVDEKDSRDNAPIFNRIVSLRDTWAKISARTR